jgi:hypothetical protein
MVDRDVWLDQKADRLGDPSTVTMSIKRNKGQTDETLAVKAVSVHKQIVVACIKETRKYLAIKISFSKYYTK